MHISLFSSQRRILPGQRLAVTTFLVSLLVAGCSSLLLFSAPFTGWLIATIIGIGLDLLRAQFVTALLATASAAFIGALVGRHKAGAILAATLAFGFGYLVGFVQLQLQPLRDPGGRLEDLNLWALLHTSLMMIAIALLCAFIGAAVGAALAEVLLSPLYRLVTFAWQQMIHSKKAHYLLPEQAQASCSTRANPKVGTLGSWLAALVMLVSIVLASGSSNLFVFSPDIGLHTLPALTSTNGLAAHGTILEDSLVSPALGGQKKSFLVYLPPSYNTPQGHTRRYPTLYLLHGSPGKDSDWFTGGKADQTADTLIALGKIPELILILPDGNGRGGETSEWGNSADGRQLIETYIASDLVTYVDKKYRTLAQPAYRGIGGNSMGGFGATNIAVHHPDIFGFVISLGGYYRAEGSVWGKNPVYIQANSPVDVLPNNRQAWNLYMYIGAATNDEPYYKDSVQLVQELEALHIPHHFDVQNGYHAWSVWQTQLYNALLWLHTILEQKH